MDALERAIENLRALGFPDQADAVRQLLDAAATFTAELGEALKIGEGWRDQHGEAAKRLATYQRMHALAMESTASLRRALRRVADTDTLEEAHRTAREALR